MVLVASCQSSELPTPTPFPPTPEEISLAAGGSSITPVPAVLADMMANPDFYEGAHVAVTGQYFRGRTDLIPNIFHAAGRRLCSI